jgi:hypothetical protein
MGDKGEIQAPCLLYLASPFYTVAPLLHRLYRSNGATVVITV